VDAIYAFRELSIGSLETSRMMRVDLLKDQQALQRLTEAAEKAKMELSSLTQTNIRFFFFSALTSLKRVFLLAPFYFLIRSFSLPFITATADDPKHIETTLTRAKFEELCSDLLDRYIIMAHDSIVRSKIIDVHNFACF